MSGRLAALDFLLSEVFTGSLAPEHLADLRKSGLSDATIQRHCLRSEDLDLPTARSLLRLRLASLERQIDLAHFDAALSREIDRVLIALEELL